MTLRHAFMALLLAPLLAAASVVIDRSGTVAAANVSQQVMPAKTSRTYLMCQNPIANTTTLFVSFDTVASTTAGSYELAPGGSVAFNGSMFVPTGIVYVTSVTTGQRFVCKEG